MWALLSVPNLAAMVKPLYIFYDFHDEIEWPARLRILTISTNNY